MNFKMPFYALLLATLLIFPQPSYAQDKAIPEDLANWAYAAVSDVADFTYLNADQRIEYIRRYFTEVGYESYTLAIRRSRVLDMMKADQGTYKGRALCIDSIEYTPVDNADYYTVTFPFLLTSNNFGPVGREDYSRVKIRIKHDETINAYGYGIEQWISQGGDLTREKVDKICRKVNLDKYKQLLKK